MVKRNVAPETDRREERYEKRSKVHQEFRKRSPGTINGQVGAKMGAVKREQESEKRKKEEKIH